MENKQKLNKTVLQDSIPSSIYQTHLLAYIIYMTSHIESCVFKYLTLRMASTRCLGENHAHNK